MPCKLITLGSPVACTSPMLTAACLPCLPSSQVLQANDNAIESLDGVTNLPRLQELVLCNNRILPSGCHSDSREDTVLHQEGMARRQGGHAPGCEEGAVAI